MADSQTTSSNIGGNTRNSALLPVLLAIMLYGLDLMSGFGGLNLTIVGSHFTSIIAVSWRTILSVMAGVTAHLWLTRGGKMTKREVTLVSIATGLFMTIFLFGGRFTIIHLIGVPLVVLLLKGPNMDFDTKLGIIIGFYIFDFFLSGIVTELLRAQIRSSVPGIENAPIFYLIPLFQLFVLSKGLEYESSKFWRAVYQLLIGAVILVAVGHGLVDVVLLNAVQQESPQDIVEGLGEFYTTGFQNIGDFFRVATHDFTQLFNFSSYYRGDKEQPEDPQGVFIEETDLGKDEYTEGEPVYVWAKLTARTLDDIIEAKVMCYTETEGVLSADFDDEIVYGQVDEDSGAKELTFEVFSGFERSIPCIFDELPPGDYDITYNVTFNFAVEARKRVYLMERSRLISDLDLLEDRGIENPTKQDVLTQIYEITDPDPESIVTSGPILVAIETDSVPWDIGDRNNIKPLFGVTIENDWDQGGKISKVNNVYFRMPKSFRFTNLERSCNLPVTSQSDPNENVYKISDNSELTNIEDYRTINCHMTIDPDESLDPGQLTIRFLRSRVEYTYVLQEKIDVDVEELGGDYGDVSDRDEVCCETVVGSSQGTTTVHRWLSSTECNSEGENVISASVVDSSYCTQECCEVTVPGDTEYHWVDDAQECDFQYDIEGQSEGRITNDRSQCENYG